MSFCRLVAACNLLLFSSALIAEQDQIVHIGNAGEPGTLDPHLYFTNLEEHILKDLFLGLTTMNAHGEIIPGSAMSWQISADQLTWTFHLRENLAWSDGKPLTANDFVKGIQRLMNPETAAPLAFFLYSLKNAREVNLGQLDIEQLGVSAIDAHTLVLELVQPFPFLPERLLYPVAYPVPSHAIEIHGEDWIKPRNWVSNGAFVLNDWRPHEFVELTKNEKFFDAENVHIQSVRYYPIVESVTGYNRYLAGELDVVSNYPSGVHEKLLADRSREVRNSPLQSIMYLVFNTQVEPFNDVRVRKALALAIDRNLLVDRILGLGEIASTTLSPPIVDHYIPVAYDHQKDLDVARKLLKDAGFSNAPLNIELRHISDDETKSVFVAIASMWREIEVVTTLHHSTLTDHFSNLNQGNFEVAQAGWFGENNPEHYIELLWSRISAANYGNYHSIAFDGLFEEAKAEGDIQARVQILNRAETLALEEYPVIPLYVVISRNLVNPNLQGWFRNGRNLHPARYFYWN